MLGSGRHKARRAKVKAMYTTQRNQTTYYTDLLHSKCYEGTRNLFLIAIIKVVHSKIQLGIWRQTRTGSAS